MLTRYFHLRENETLGQLGWLMEGAPSSYEPGGGMTTAHDILEHQPNDNGSIEHELMALGAMVHVRMEGCYWSRHGSLLKPVEHLSSGLVFLFNNYRDEFESLTRYHKRTHAVVQHEDLFTDVLNTFRADEDVRELCSRSFLRSWTSRALPWLRVGYRKSAARFRSIPSWTLTSCFMSIEKQVDDLTLRDEAQYCRLVVKADAAAGTAHVYLEGYEDL